MRLHKSRPIKTQFLHRLQIIDLYLEKSKRKMKVFRDFVFSFYFLQETGKSRKTSYPMHTVRKGPGEFSPGPFIYFFLSWPLSVGTAVFSSDICLVNRSSGKGGDASGFAAMDISKSGLSSAAIRLEWNTPHLRHRWINAHSPFLRTHTPTGSIMPPQQDARSPGTWSRWTLDRQNGQ